MEKFDTSSLPARNAEERGPDPVVVGINPDRVRTEMEATGSKKIVTREAGSHWEPFEDVRTRGGELIFEKIPPLLTAKTWLKGTIAAALLGTAATNISTEHENLEAIGNSVESQLGDINMETLAQRVTSEVCQLMNVDFMHRFQTLDENGNEQFNPGGFVVPFAVELTENCKTRVDVEVHVPYHFARTFREIAAKNPEERNAIVERLSELIKKQIQDEVTIHGIAGVTETTLVYNRAHGTLGETPRIDLNDLHIENIVATGKASAEAQRSEIHAESASLTQFNPENQVLATRRLNDTLPLLREAFEKAGADPETIENITGISYEQDLHATQINELATMSDAILGVNVVATPEEKAYTLIQEFNAWNSTVRRALRENSDFQQTFDNLVTNNRGVDITFNVTGEQNKTSVYNIPIPLPLLLLLIPLFKTRRGPLTVDRFQNARLVDHKEESLTETTYSPKHISRRLFSETTPQNLTKNRSFHDVYSAINLSERPQDTYNLYQHMLLEEVGPSLPEFSSMPEPMIDYEAVANRTREYLYSHTRKNEVTKGSYETTDEAERFMTEELLSMWERHDAATYPMEGIDIKTVLNYRHSPQVVYWAKTLAYQLTQMTRDTTTSEDFCKVLTQAIGEAAKSRTASGNSRRNKPVTSSLPLRG